MQYSAELEQLGIIYTQTHFACTHYHKWPRSFEICDHMGWVLLKCIFGIFNVFLLAKNISDNLNSYHVFKGLILIF